MPWPRSPRRAAWPSSATRCSPTIRSTSGGAAVSVLQQAQSLTFGLGGLSKSVGLPQVKLAWIGVSGPAALVDEALHGLEIVADTFLSVSTPVQLALDELLRAGAEVRAQIQARVDPESRRARASTCAARRH